MYVLFHDKAPVARFPRCLSFVCFLDCQDLQSNKFETLIIITISIIIIRPHLWPPCSGVASDRSEQVGLSPFFYSNPAKTICVYIE